MAEERFKAGDTVQLQSGGPIMTVEFYNDAGRVGCSWFVKDEKKQDRFVEESLKEYKND